MHNNNQLLSLKNFIIPSFLTFSLTLSKPAFASNGQDESNDELLSATDLPVTGLSATDWSLLISADTFLIACVLGWILYTYCFPHKVWRFWQKLFAFDALPEGAMNEKK